MDKMIYILALVIATLVGFRLRKGFFDDSDSSTSPSIFGGESPRRKFEAFKEAIEDGEYLDLSETKLLKNKKGTTKEEKSEPRTSKKNPLKAVDWRWLLGSVIVCLILTLIMDGTYAYFISSWPWVIFWLALALIFGYFLSLSLDVIKDSSRGGLRVLFAAIGVAIIFPILFTFIHIYVAIAAVIITYLYLGRHAIRHPLVFVPALKGFAAMFCVSLLLMGVFNPMVHPEGVENPLFKSIENNETKAPQTSYISNLDEIRVISWDLATQYLQRAYGESASIFETDPYILSQNTDPSYVNGKFVWVNAPQYQFLKWTGDKDVPFFVYVVNEPEKMNKENPDIVHKVDKPLVLHKERIEWKNRLWNLPFDKYAGQYEVTQIRIDMDDSNTPFWIIYLSERCVQYNMPNLKKILIVSVEDINDYSEYDVTDNASIPSWLEVVYPDQYVYEWVTYWGSYRQGLVYSWFNKKHLYDPDDVSARFLIVQNKTYWQVPVRQKDSEVLGGYVQVDTRTGKAIFWNREAKSYVGLWTIEQQITSYLSSGQVGFQQLSIHEGYLYPIKMNDNTVRDAYIFPLYAGFTVQKYAIVDAELYTAAPTIDTSLQDALATYRSKGAGGSNQTNLTWTTYTISNAFAETDDVVLTLKGNHTFTVQEDDLKGGLVDRPKDEFKELKLAVSEHQRIGNVTIDVVIDHEKIVDVDYLGADLVKKP